MTENVQASTDVAITLPPCPRCGSDTYGISNYTKRTQTDKLWLNHDRQTWRFDCGLRFQRHRTSHRLREDLSAAWQDSDWGPWEQSEVCRGSREENKP